jgi:hypothetical protein
MKMINNQIQISQSMSTQLNFLSRFVLFEKQLISLARITIIHQPKREKFY